MVISAVHSSNLVFGVAVIFTPFSLFSMVSQSAFVEYLYSKLAVIAISCVPPSTANANDSGSMVIAGTNALCVAFTTFETPYFSFEIVISAVRSSTST